MSLDVPRMRSYWTKSYVTDICSASCASWGAPHIYSVAHAAVVFKGEIWMVAGVSTSYYTKRLEKTTTRSDVVHSKDGSTWVEVLEEAPFRRRYGHSLTAFTDPSDGAERLLLIGGFSPEPATDIWMSTNGGVCVWDAH